MSKNRLETLADGIFAIAMTLLVFNIHKPVLSGAITDAALLEKIISLRPEIIAYFISFAVIGMFWLSHHAFFNLVLKNVNRRLVLFNLAYLSLIALIPFSAQVLGAYPDLVTANVLYGLNLVTAGLVAWGMFSYALASGEIDTSHVDKRLQWQATIRVAVTPVFGLLGICISFISPTWARLMFAVPLIFNMVPGTLTFIEDRFSLNFDHVELVEEEVA